MKLLLLGLFVALWLTPLEERAQVRTGPLSSPVHCDAKVNPGFEQRDLDPGANGGAPSCGFDIRLAEVQALHKSAKGQFLRATTDHLICHSHATVGHYYSWAPSEHILDGSEALATLLRRAETGEIFGNDHIIVQTPESKPSERHLALCSIENISGTPGPPKDCTTVGIITPSTAWLRTGSDISYCLMAGEILRSGAIEIDYTVRTALSPNVFADALQAMMKQRLALTTERRLEGARHEFVILRSTGGLRNSQVLEGGWRESLDFDVTIYQENTDVRVSGIAHIAVCRQALGSLTQYVGLDDAQRSHYLEFLNDVVGVALKSKCKSSVQRDAANIGCNT